MNHENETICMDIRVFAEKICSAVSRELGEDYQVKLQEVTKNNGVILQGLVILTQEQNVSPTIYLNSFMEAYEKGIPLRRIIDKVLEIYREDSPKKNLDMSFFRKFDQVKDRICYRLVNREKNRILLERIPHVDFLDLCICFYYAYHDNTLGAGSILIYNNHVEMWNSSVGELMELAIKNTPKLFPWEAYSMEEMLQEIVQPDPGSFPDTSMLVLSNTDKIQGAVCMIYPKVLDRMADRMGGDFFILPSSIHEVILLRCDEEDDTNMLRSMIRDINASQVEPEEVLSDNLYIYHSKESQIAIVNNCRLG